MSPPAWVIAAVDQAAALARDTYDHYGVDLADPIARRAVLVTLLLLDPNVAAISAPAPAAWLGTAQVVAEHRR